MIQIAEVHLSPGVTVPLLVVAVVAAAGYWRRLARASVPRIRRRLRRAGLLVGLVAALASVVAMSFLDPEARPGSYLVLWGLIVALLVPAVSIAVADVMVTVRLHRTSLERRAARDAVRIRAAFKAADGRADDDRRGD